MPLKPMPGDFVAPTGSPETIQFLPGTHGTIVTIVSVLYGANSGGPMTVPLNPDNVSFNFNVLAGSNMLQVTLFSPNEADGSAIAQQSSGGVVTVLEDDIEFVGGVAIWSPEILGI